MLFYVSLRLELLYILHGLRVAPGQFFVKSKINLRKCLTKVCLCEILATMEQIKCRLCGECLPINKFKRTNGTVFYMSKRTCYLCNPYNPYTNSCAYKAHVRLQVKRHPDKVQIIGECECASEKKVHHHHDYNKPFEVYLLCNSCHVFMHRREPPIEPFIPPANQNAPRIIMRG